MVRVHFNGGFVRSMEKYRAPFLPLSSLIVATLLVVISCQTDPISGIRPTSQSKSAIGTFDILPLPVSMPRKMSCDSIGSLKTPRVAIPLSGGGLSLLSYESESKATLSQVSAKMSRAYDSVIGDINGDGLNDIVVATLDGNSIELFEAQKNSGKGESFLQTSLAQNVRYPYGLSLGDVNKDGHLDIAVAEYEANRISLLVNKSGKRFDLLTVSNATQGPQTVKFADMDKDGNSDLVSTGRSGHRVLIHFNEQQNRFTDLVISTEILEPNYALPVDVDGDSHLDILIASRKSPNLYWARNKGNRNFEKPVPLITDAAGTYSILPFDIDSDGDLDFLTVSISENVLKMHLNMKNLSFKTEIIDSSFQEAQSIVECDLNQDGQPEFIASGAAANQIRIYKKRF